MALSLGELAALVGGEVRGDGTRLIERVRVLESAGPADLSFLTHRRYRQAARESRAGAILVGPEPPELAQDLLLAGNPTLALGTILHALHPEPRPEPGVHPTAEIATTAVVDPAATVGPYCVIGDGATIAAGAVLDSHVVVGGECRVGRDARLHPGVVLYPRTEVGERALLCAGAIVGADGFGYAHTEGGHQRLPHVGRAVLEEDVELGANTTVDRALLEETRIGAGSKLDNLVMVGHNVRLGADSAIAAQSGISGSTRVGRRLLMGGQSGMIGHLKVGDDVVVASKSALMRDAPDGAQVAGSPAIDRAVWRRQQALMARLAKLSSRLRRLERRLAELEEGES